MWLPVRHLGICRQPKVSFNNEGDNSLFFKFGFAGDDGLNPVSPFALARCRKHKAGWVREVLGNSTIWVNGRYQCLA